MTAKEVNEVLRITFKGLSKVISTSTDKNYEDKKEQGITGQKITISQVGEYFVKKIEVTDSYGDNERIVSISFVEPKLKQITDYEEL